jgi:hypothetical protein
VLDLVVGQGETGESCHLHDGITGQTFGHEWRG